tara:strand:- start:1404 stop:2135 length:732 start_codon:yes stop_codon:yes gene_type:complete
MKYLVAFVDDNKELNAPDEKLAQHPSVAFFLSPYGQAATGEDGEIYRPQSEKNQIQEELDQLFDSNFGERMYNNDGGIDDALMVKLVNFFKKNPSCTTIYFDHDLTLTCHHGLLETHILNAFFSRFVLDNKTFNQYVGYFFGGLGRYKKLKKLLDKLRSMNITIKILTKQPDTKSIELNMKLCKLDEYFDEYISSEKKNMEKLDWIQKEIDRGMRSSKSPRALKNRSPKLAKKTKSPKKKQST